MHITWLSVAEFKHFRTNNAGTLPIVYNSAGAWYDTLHTPDTVSRTTSSGALIIIKRISKAVQLAMLSVDLLVTKVAEPTQG